MPARGAGSPTPEVMIGPVMVDGAATRLVRTADGGAVVETWGGPAAGWIEGGAMVDELVGAPAASEATLAALGVPADANSLR